VLAAAIGAPAAALVELGTRLSGRPA
jgi:hypothetical protein